MHARDILFHDRALIAVVKRPAVLTAPDRTSRPDALSAVRDHIQAAWNLKSLPWLAPAHRLDYAASGVLLFAKSSKSARVLALAHDERAIKKTYLAVVSGSPPSRSGEWSHILRKTSNTRRPRTVRIISNDRKRPLPQPRGHIDQDAKLAWRVVAQMRNLSLMEIDLITGRRHQIRSQFAHEGLPIVGDTLYGASASARNVRSSDWKMMNANEAIALHASNIDMPHPITQAQVVLSAAVPHLWTQAFGIALTNMANKRIKEIRAEGEAGNARRDGGHHNDEEMA